MSARSGISRRRPRLRKRVTQRSSSVGYGSSNRNARPLAVCSRTAACRCANSEIEANRRPSGPISLTIRADGWWHGPCCSACAATLDGFGANVTMAKFDSTLVAFPNRADSPLSGSSTNDEACSLDRKLTSTLPGIQPVAEQLNTRGECRPTYDRALKRKLLFVAAATVLAGVLLLVVSSNSHVPRAVTGVPSNSATLAVDQQSPAAPIEARLALSPTIDARASSAIKPDSGPPARPKKTAQPTVQSAPRGTTPSVAASRLTPSVQDLMSSRR